MNELRIKELLAAYWEHSSLLTKLADAITRKDIECVQQYCLGAKMAEAEVWTTLHQLAMGVDRG